MENEIYKIFNRITTKVSIICTMLTTIFGIEWVLFMGYLLLNLIDYLTGTIKAKVNKVENSNKGIKGILRKVSYWILIVISFLISYLLMQLGNKINIDLEFIMIFGWFTLICLIINESRSIIENLVQIGIDVPIPLKKGLETYQNIVNNTFEKLNNKK